jgi:ABC-2 type transport system ATP-binding protein
MAQPVAELRHATKRFGAVTALDDVDLALAPGRVTAILGQNGAGKTTAVRLMIGLTQPNSGTAQLFGLDPRSLAARQRVGVMLQISKVPETLKVREHIHLFSSYYPAPMPAKDVIAIAGLEGLDNRAFGKLSGGEKQRVLFALAICGNPDLLVLDEPTVGLDVETRRRFWHETRQLIARGRSLLLTTHYLEEADALADRIVILQHGRIIADGTPAGIKARVGGRQIRCVTRTPLDAARALDTVLSARMDGDALVLIASDAESVARDLLKRDPALSALEITRANLEDAFVAITEAGTPALQEAR